MEQHIGKIWLALLALVLVIAIFAGGEDLKPIGTKSGENPFLKAVTQLGILYIVALFVERSIEVLIKVWRQGEKTDLKAKKDMTRLDEFKAGTQKRALLSALTLGTLVSLSGVRILGPIFDIPSGLSLQEGLFRFTDIVITAGLIAGGSSTIHEMTALIDDFLKSSRNRTKSQTQIS